MATTAVDLVVKTVGLAKLVQLDRALKGTAASAVKAGSGVDQLTGKLSKTGQQIRRAANGLEYFIDKAGRARKANGQFVTTAEAAAAGIQRFGKNAQTAGNQSQVAAKGVSLLNKQLKKLSLVLLSGSTVAKFFKGFTEAENARAAVSTLGVDAAALEKKLLSVSAASGNLLSQTQLLAASYDVASAGFNTASDAATVLEASLKGAVGGLSDIGTVSNAVTSVLNAYGLSADKAGKLVDGFIQTQNDGKIVVDQYAQQIGRLAPTAAAAGIGIDELNAAISTVTAQGVPIESTFAGLRQGITSILKPSKEAQDLAKSLGIEFNEAALKSKGFGGVLEEVKRKTGGSTTALTTLFGSVEALAAILPLVNDDLVSFNTNLDNQANAAGVAEKATEKLGGTVTSQITRMVNGIGNLVRALDNVLGPALQDILTQINNIITQATKALSLLGDLNLGQATRQLGIGGTQLTFGFESDAVDSLSNALTSLDIGSLQSQDELKKATNVVERISKQLTRIGPNSANADRAVGLQGLVTQLKREISDRNEFLKAAGQTTQPTTGGVDPAAAARDAKLDAILKKLGGNDGSGSGRKPKKDDLAAIAQLAYGPQIIAAAKANNLDPRLLAGLVQVESGFNARAVSSAGAAGLTQLMPGTAGDLGVTDRFNPMQNLMGGAKYLRQMLGMFGDLPSALRAYNQGPGNQQRFPGGVSQEAVQYPGKVLAAAKNFGFGGEAIAGANADAFQSLQKQQEIAAKLLAEAEERLTVAQSQLEIEQQMNPLQRAQLEAAERQRKITEEYNELIGKATEDETKKILEKAKGIELQLEEVKLSKELKDLRESATKSITDEIEMLEARLNGTEDVLEAEREIARLRSQGVGGAQARALVETRNQLEQQVEAQDKAKASAEALAGSISSALTDSLRGLIDGSMSAEEALSNAFKGIADAFLDMAMQMIQEWIKMQLIGLVGNFFGGAGRGFGGGGFGAGTFNLSGGQFGAFAEGGFVTGPTPALIGEGGEPEYIIPSSKMSSAMARYSQGARGSSVIPDSAGGGGDANNTPTFRLETTVINGVEYATVEQVRAMGQQAARQGAAAGTARTMSNLKNNRSTRSKLGM